MADLDSYGASLAWEGVLDEIEDYLAQREDIRDGGDGKPLPNEAMCLLSDLRWWRQKTKAQAPTERKPSAEAAGKPGTEARQQLAAEIAAGGNAFILDSEKRRVIVEALRDGPEGELRVVFDGRAGKDWMFVECEDASGRSINAGEWRDRADGLWELVIKSLPPATSRQWPAMEHPNDQLPHPHSDD